MANEFVANAASLHVKRSNITCELRYGYAAVRYNFVSEYDQRTKRDMPTLESLKNR